MCLALLLLGARAGGDVVVYESEGTYGELRYAAFLVWNEGSYVLDVTTTLDEKERNITRARYTAERRVSEGMAAAFVQSLVDLQVSSRETVGSRLRDQPSLLSDLRTLAGAAGKTRSHLDEELRSLVVRYQIPLYGPASITDVFVAHEHSVPVRIYLPFAPSEDYTALVIYAKGEYPSWGQPGVVRALVPSLFPRVFDTDMRIVADLARMDPTAVVAHGAVRYINTVDEGSLLALAGTNPLRIMARAVFGVSSTDLVIPVDAARALLVREQNRALLRNAEIVIVIDAPSPN